MGSENIYKPWPLLAVRCRLYLRRGTEGRIDLLPDWRELMKRIATLKTTVALMFNLGVASVYAQHVPLTLSFSGYCCVHTDQPAARRSCVRVQYRRERYARSIHLSYCRSQLAARRLPGQSPSLLRWCRCISRFEDGSLLMVNLTQGSDCLQFTSTGPVAHCTRTFQITGGTGRLKCVRRHNCFDRDGPGGVVRRLQ